MGSPEELQNVDEDVLGEGFRRLGPKGRRYTVLGEKMVNRVAPAVSFGEFTSPQRA